MRAIHQTCEVTARAQDGAPKVIYWAGRTYHLTHILDQYRAGGRWWLDGPRRHCWVIQCGTAVLDVDLLEPRTKTHLQQWVLARLQD